MKRAILLALLLGGCQTTEDRIAADDRTCQSYGVAVGSPGYVDCRKNLDAGRSNVTASERFARGGGIIGALKGQDDR